MKVQGTRVSERKLFENLRASFVFSVAVDGLVSWKTLPFGFAGVPTRFGKKSQVVRKLGLPCPPMFLEARTLRPPSREVKTPFSVFFPRLSHLGRLETASPRPANRSWSPYRCTLCRPHVLSCPVSGVQAHPLPFLVPAWLWMSPGQGAPRCPPAFPHRARKCGRRAWAELQEDATPGSAAPPARATGTRSLSACTWGQRNRATIYSSTKGSFLRLWSGPYG